jgi:mRNA interferase MazF
MFKGAVVLVPFPFTDLSGNKVRPALVLHTKTRGDDCIVGFISSVHKKEGALDLSVEASKSNGLKVNSVVKVEKIATLQKKIVIGELGVLEPLYMKEVDKKLKILFNL